jgi:hypothetical protein
MKKSKKNKKIKRKNKGIQKRRRRKGAGFIDDALKYVAESDFLKSLVEAYYDPSGNKNKERERIKSSISLPKITSQYIDSPYIDLIDRINKPVQERNTFKLKNIILPALFASQNAEQLPNGKARLLALQSANTVLDLPDLFTLEPDLEKIDYEVPSWLGLGLKKKGGGIRDDIIKNSSVHQIHKIDFPEYYIPDKKAIEKGIKNLDYLNILTNEEIEFLMRIFQIMIWGDDDWSKESLIKTIKEYINYGYYEEDNYPFLGNDDNAQDFDLAYNEVMVPIKKEYEKIIKKLLK